MAAAAQEENFSKPVELSLQALIVYSIVTSALETMPEMSAYRAFFQTSEVTVVALFTAEYLARWWRSHDRLRYPLRPMAIIDLLAVLPAYLELGIDLRSLRAVRLLRLFRLLKLGRYSRGLQTLGEAVQRCLPELAACAAVALVAMLLSAMAMYYAEHEAQPEVYRSIPVTLWWAVVTLTTVGYGDVYPVTVVGRIVAAFVMLCGVGIIAVPTGIISSAMTEILRERRRSSGADAAPGEPIVKSDPTS